MYQISKILTVVSILVISIVFVLLPSVNMNSLMNGTQSGKSIVFLWGIGIISALSIIRFWLNPGLKKINLSIIDLLLFTFVLYILIQNNRTEMIHSLLFLELTGLAILYFIIRQQNHQSYLWLLMALIAGGLIQSIYGNLQLWGYFPSHHGIFKMTGSFFNPGPYAGYLAAVFPVAVGLYFGRSNVRVSESLSVESTPKRLKERHCEARSNLELYVFRILRFLPFVTNDETLLLGVDLDKINVVNNRNISNGEASNIVPSIDGSNNEAPNISNSEASNITNPSNSLDLNLLNGAAIVRLIAIITIVSIVLVLPASRSRAAWLGAIAGCLFVFQTIIRQRTNQTGEASNIQTYFFKPFKQLNLLQKRGLMVVCILISVLSLVGMYKFKQGSADGRLLIWKVSAEMIKDKPIFGHGADKFAADYMNYQAAYFKPNPDVPEAMQADNVTYAYNEFLKLTVEKGTIGLLLGLAVVWSLFFLKTGSGDNKRSNLSLLAARGGLLAVIVFAQFSYPSDILPIKMLFVLFAAIVATHQSPIKLFQLGKKVTALMLTPKAAFAGTVVWYAALVVALMAVYPASQYLARHYQAYKSWKDASDIYNVGAYPECLEDFELAYPQLKYNGAFLVQYGKALEMAEKYENSIAILNEAKQHLHNTILYTCLGDNYKALGTHIQAEQAYLHAWYMAPARFYPLYLLAKLYNETGQKEKAVTMAKKVMEKEEKVESIAIKEIKEEMRKIIEKGDAELLNKSQTHTDNNLDPIYKGTKEGASRSKVYTSKFMLQKW